MIRESFVGNSDVQHILRAIAELDLWMSTSRIAGDRPIRRVPMSAICMAIALKKTPYSVLKEELGDDYPSWHDALVAVLVMVAQRGQTLSQIHDSAPWSDPDELTLWANSLLEQGILELIPGDEPVFRMTGRMQKVWRLG